jgi:tetratricopeptide (TPR) repeat protein
LTTGGLERAKEYFDQAIAKDPNFARAYEGLAWYYWGVGDWLLPMPEAGPKAMDAARAAVRIDDSLPDGHAVLGAGYLWYEFKWTEAEKEIQRALQLNPKSWRARELNASLLVSLGRFDDAIAQARLLTQSDPLSARYADTLGRTLFFAKRYDEAVDVFQNSLRLDPTIWETYSLLGQAYLKKQSFPDAIAQFKKARELEDTISEPLAFLGRAYALAGNKAEAQKLLQELEARSTQRHVSRYLLAIVNDALGNRDKAMALLEKAAEDHSFHMSTAAAAPELEALRSDPKFQKLLAALAFPH